MFFRVVIVNILTEDNKYINFYHIYYIITFILLKIVNQIN